MKDETSNQVWWFRIILVLAMAFLLSRGVFLTTVMGGYFAELADDNMTRRVSVYPERGVILDKNKKILAQNIENEGEVVRFYPFGEVMAGILGYVGKPTVEELKDCVDRCDGERLIGKTGLEKVYQKELEGVPGEEMRKEVADGSEYEVVARLEPVESSNVVTNIDVELQKNIYVSLKKTLEKVGTSGSVVLSKVNGEIVSMVSLPSYDNNLFIANGKRSDFGGDYKSVSDLLADQEKLPLFNRAISGEFAPGSVYKLVPAMAALAEGEIDKTTKIMDIGEIKVGEYRFGNWYLDEYGRTEGEIDVETAISRSNDIFFYKIGEMLGVDRLDSWSAKYGLGTKTGVDLVGEKEGLLPTPLWREKILGSKWYLGNTYHLSIGQGDLLTTPLQINRMTAAMVGGTWCPPRLVGLGQCRDLGVDENSRQTILKGMQKTCEPGGTAYPLFKYAGKIYCKTGTAQQGGEEDLPHAWMSVVVPKGEKVEDWLVLTVMVQAGGQGSGVAAPIAAEIMPFLVDEVE